ncbi:DUF402 domain-containing protein [Chloroflexota bacterium]
MMITIIKQNPDGQETWRYSGTILKRSKNYLLLEAFFDRDDMEIHGMKLCKGDHFLETYYFDRWYNIFEIHDHLDNKLKGWYCNISSPAIEKNGQLTYRDLSLDLLVFPDGRQIVLDEDEFAALELSPMEKNNSLAALVELQNHFKLFSSMMDQSPL